ncbi:MFS transporter [Rhodococcus ruber]|nr:MFS transporter [Rhodococcus ruber]QDC12777.1 MFS transporter [Rhodococcus ruber]
MTSVSGALRNPDFARLCVGQAVAQLGSRGYGVAIMLWVLAVSGSAATVGLVSTVTMGAFTAATVPAGWIVDRFDRRRVMITVDACSAVAAAVLAYCAWRGLFHPVPVLAAVSVLGAGWAVRGLAEDAAVPQVVEREQIGTAYGLFEARGYATGVAGPPLAATLYGLGAALPFAGHAVSFVVAGAAAARVRTPLQAPRGPGPVAERPWASIREGLRWFASHRFVRTTAALTAVAEFVVNGCGLVVVVLLAGSGAPSSTVGIVLAGAYGGGMLGALAVPRLRRRIPAHRLLVLSAALGVLAVLAAATGSPFVAAAGYAALLAVTPSWSVVVTARCAELVPDAVRGRVGAATGLVTSLPAMFAPLTVGVLTTAVGAASTAWMLAALLGGVAVAAALSRTVRLQAGEPLARRAVLGGEPVDEFGSGYDGVDRADALS